MKNTPEQADGASKLSFSASIETTQHSAETPSNRVRTLDPLTLHEYDFPSYEDAYNFLLTIQHVVPGGLVGGIDKSNTLSIAIPASAKCSIDRLYSSLPLATPNEPCYVIDYTISGSHYRVVQVLEANLLTVLSLLRAHSGITYTVRRGVVSLETGKLISVGSLVGVS